MTENSHFQNRANSSQQPADNPSRIDKSPLSISLNNSYTNHVQNGSSTHDHSLENGTVNGTSSTNIDMLEDDMILSPPRRDLVPWEENVIRLIGQHLRKMGYHKTVEALVAESGCTLEHILASVFRKHILCGNWPGAEKALVDLTPLLEDGQVIQQMRFLMLEQKYLELLETEKDLEALSCLRCEISQILPNFPANSGKTERLHELSTYMMCRNKEELRAHSKWPGIQGGSRHTLVEQLETYLPVQAVLPRERLDELLTQSLTYQISKCPYHVCSLDVEAFHDGLLQNHTCPQSTIPTEQRYVLRDHVNEVWYIQFSHDGKRLASGSKDGKVILWDMCVLYERDDTKISDDTTTEPSPTPIHTLTAQTTGVGYLSWSPDDKYIIVCGIENSSEVMVFETSTGNVKCTVNQSLDDSLTACSWFDNEIFFVAGTKGHFYQCDLDGTVLETWEGLRVFGLQTLPNSKTVLASDSHMRIRHYNFETKTDTNIIQESHDILSFTLSPDHKFALLNLCSQGLHMWDLEDKSIVRYYTGLSQGYCTIYSCFGGPNATFIASGSEDKYIYIWHRSRSKYLVRLNGHSRTVNCVHWNPKQPDVLASASDDTTIRIWTPKSRHHTLTNTSKKKSTLATKKDYNFFDEYDNPREFGPHSNEERCSPPPDPWQQRQCSSTTHYTTQHTPLGLDTARLLPVNLGQLGQLLTQGLIPFHTLDTSNGLITLSQGTGSDSRTSSEGSTAV